MSRLEQEIVLEDGNPVEELAMPSRTWEFLARFDQPPGDWKPVRARLRVAQPGTVRWTFYANSSLEQPSDVLATFDRTYTAEMIGGADQARWVVESLEGVVGDPHGAVWVGVRQEGGQPKLWAAQAKSGPGGGAFVRDIDPTRLLSPMPLKKVPMLRLDWGAK